MTSVPSALNRDVPLTELSAELLIARIARAELYVLDMTAVGGASAVNAALQRDHLSYLYALEMQGRLYGSGPVEAESTGSSHELAIVAAANRAEAERIALNEPLVRAGVRQVRVRSHMMNEGIACYVGRALHKRAQSQGAAFEPDTTGSLSLEELRSRAAGAELFLLRLDSTHKVRPPEETQSRIDHFVWLRDNEMSARMMSCGPIFSSTPNPPDTWVSGLGIFATSRDEAERLAAIEPSGLMGYRAVSVQSWRLDYGLAAPIANALVTLNRL